jgi:hypothetical protein
VTPLEQRIAFLRSRLAELELREASHPSWRTRDSMWQLRAALKDAERELAALEPLDHNERRCD